MMHGQKNIKLKNLRSNGRQTDRTSI